MFDISRNNAQVIRRRLSEKVEIRLNYSSVSSTHSGKSKSVIATLPGKTSSYYLVSAHGDSDSGGPGADDNASGVAGVLELSHALSSMVMNRSLKKPECTIKFAVWGTEYASAETFVRRNADSLQSILGVLNFDEIGTGATRNCIYFEGNDVKANAPLLRVLKSVGEDFVGKKSYWKEATTNVSQGGTDSYVFLSDYLGRLGLPKVEIPSVTIYTAAWEEPKIVYQPKEWQSRSWKGIPDSISIDYSLYYHSSLDTPAMTTDKVPEKMEWGVKAVGIALLRLAW
jgi:hypothetical protein